MSQTTILEGGNLGSLDVPYQIASHGVHSNQSETVNDNE